jgi:uncharacterized protein
MFKDNYGPWAVIAGGSDGIGAAFAHALAARGLHLVLIARNPETLETISQEIRKKHPGTQIVTLPLDLAKLESADKVVIATDQLDIGCFVYNVGSESSYGDFLSHDKEFVVSRMNRNFVVKAMLTHHFARRMVARGKGGIILMGSMSGYYGSPGFALYAASKGFTRYLSEGLWFELKKSNVDLLCPVVGPTATPTMLKSYGKLENAADPNDVANQALDRLKEGPIWVSELIADRIKYVEGLPPGERVALAAKWGEDFAVKGKAPSA